MARVRYLDHGDLAETDQDLLERPINLHRALANNTGVLRQWQSFAAWIRWKGSIDARMRELAIIQVGLSASSAYEVTHHVEIARSFGVTESDLDDLARLAGGQQPSLADVTVVSAAREMTQGPSLHPATWAALIDAVGEPDAIEYVVVIGFYCMVTRVLAALEVDVEPEYQQHMPYFLLATAER
jgi:alkylhydroperoxidase family enzyme